MRPVDENALTSPHIRLPKEPHRPRRFRSLRWRVMLPLVAALMAVLMCGAYGLSYTFIRQDTRTTGEADLIAVSQAAAQNAIQVGRTQRTEVDRIAFTQGVAQGIVDESGFAIQPLVEPLAALANLDMVIVGGADASEIIGLQRVVVAGSIDYEVTEKSDLSAIRAVQSVLNGADSASEIVSVNRRTLLVTAGPVLNGGQLVGVVLVGVDINRVLTEVQSGTNTELALFVNAGLPLSTTLEGDERATLDGQAYAHALSSLEGATLERLKVGDRRYQAAYFPFVIGQTPLGVLGVYEREQTSFAADFGRQMLSLFFAGVLGVVCIVAYVALGRQFGRMDRLRQTVDRMAGGEEVQINMKPHDEIGELGVAVDRFAAAAKVQVKQMQTEVRQNRRQIAHLNAIFESLQDAVIVQDYDGRVMNMNGAARSLFGAYGDHAAAMTIRTWALQAEQRAGELAAGLIALQETTLLEVNGRIMKVRAALLESVADKLMGKVITLQDVTEDVKRQAHRDELIDKLSRSVHDSMTQRAQAAAMEAATQPMTMQYDALDNFAKEIAQDARAMQRMITEYRDLTLLRPNELRERQQPVNVIDLMTILLEEWRAAASAANVNLTVSLPDDDWHILGDEKRLLMALGNILDNALKYNDGGGQVKLSVVPKEEQSRLVLKIEDEGVGIDSEDLPHVFTRFYRGKPRKQDGQPLEVIGTGQGLFLAHKIVEAHGGELVLASLLGQGTQVSVVLPLTAEVMLDFARMETTPNAVAATGVQSLWDMPTHAALKVERGE